MTDVQFATLLAFLMPQFIWSVVRILEIFRRKP